jgi:phosphatidylserine/phosphatidylglycerophosphate/cardiolipin synthase-like enzyme
MSIADRIDKYFVTEADVDGTLGGIQVPVTTEQNRVTYLIDGTEYFGALRQEVEAFKQAGSASRFFYFTDWVLWLTDYNGTATVGGLPSAWTEPINTTAFHLDDLSGGTFPPFLDELAALAANDIDVRALGFVSPFVLNINEVAEKNGHYSDYAGTLLSIQALRDKPGMGYRACLNLLAHPAGAMHLKMVICGDNSGARGYTSGIDFKSDRIDDRTHTAWKSLPDRKAGWHDIAVKVEGPAVDTMYSFFRQLWNEQIQRKVEKFRIGDQVIASHSTEYEEVPERTSLPVTGGTHHVQVLRTAPQVHIAFGATPAIPANCLFRLAAGFKRPPLSFAPDGIFEFRAALRKAIAAAEKYIYIEDQAFVGVEIMDWINSCLKDTPDLKVIMVNGRDPNDPTTQQTRMELATAIDEHLCADLGGIGQQVVFFTRPDTAIHSKTWIIDDEYVIVGSANVMQRSLYTDCELSVAVLDEDETASAFPVNYRANLWAEHCGVLDDAGRASFEDIDSAIKIWNPAWSINGTTPAPAGTLLADFVQWTVPLTGSTRRNLSGEQRSIYDAEYQQDDTDSREDI